MARTIFQDWFVDFGPTRAKMEGQEPHLPPELWDKFPNQLVDSELGEIPEGWEVGVHRTRAPSGHWYSSPTVGIRAASIRATLRNHSGRSLTSSL